VPNSWPGAHPSPGVLSTSDASISRRHQGFHHRADGPAGPLNEQDSLAITIGDISTNLVGVYKALGGGWEIRERDDLVPPEIREEMTKRTNWGRLLVPGSYNPSSLERPKSSIRLPDW